MIAVLNPESAANISKTDIETQLRQHITAINLDLEPHAQVGGLILFREPRSVNNGTLTHTHKIRRNVVEDTYTSLCDQIINSDASDLAIVWAD